jgi:hypothetical protein
MPYRRVLVAIALVIALMAVVLFLSPGVANAPFIYQRF